MKTVEETPTAIATQPKPDEQVRFEKISLLRTNNPQQSVGIGAFIAEGDTLRFEMKDKKGNVSSVELPHVHDVHYTKDAWAGSYVTIEYGDAPVKILKVRDLGGGALHAKAATRTLDERLRNALAITPLSTDQQAAIEKVQLEVEKRQGMNHMLWGGIAAIVGFLVTVITYANASDGGGTYLVWWGPMLFGIAYFIYGVFEYTRRRPKM